MSILTKSETKKMKSEKAYPCFADMRTAFDKLRRKEIWRIRRKNVDSKLAEKIKEIYKETSCKVKIRENQKSSPSATLFNVAFADLKEEMSKVQGGLVIGAKQYRQSLTQTMLRY